MYIYAFSALLDFQQRDEENAGAIRGRNEPVKQHKGENRHIFSKLVIMEYARVMEITF